MANKYQTLLNGREKLVEAMTVSTGASDAGKIPAVGADGRLDESLMPVGIAADVKVAIASEALSAGDYVNIYDDAGTTKCRKADSTNARQAHGFVKSSVALNSNATIYFEGPNSVSGATAGVRYYLTASGGFTSTPPSSPTDVIHQYLGIGIDSTTINTDIEDVIVL